jgi:hypothetical protein
LGAPLPAPQTTRAYSLREVLKNGGPNVHSGYRTIKLFRDRCKPLKGTSLDVISRERRLAQRLEGNSPARKPKFPEASQRDSSRPVCGKKYSASHRPQINGFFSSSRLNERGVRVVTNVEAGCGGRGSVRRFCARRLAPTRTAKPCGPGAPTLALSLQCPTSLAGDGGKKARFTGESAE